MESYGIPMGGFQLPMQRRLSRLYSDTKSSSDFVKEPVQNAESPEMRSLHRKLKIQKDRFVSWGLEWSDPISSSSASGEIIDDSLSKAGLSEVAGSILSTIKDILAEAEPLWNSFKRQGSGARDVIGMGDKKVPIVVWDKARFEDLLKDLTVSIDTLYDLSRTRSSGVDTSQAISKLGKGSSSVDDFRAFESTRMVAPRQIYPQSLTSLRNNEDAAGGQDARDIVLMSRQAFADLARQTGRQQGAPLLLEYAAFDSMYSAVGIMPPMAKFEKLSAGLQTESQRSPTSWSGLPCLLGYFEDMEHSRLGLVYYFPPTFNPVSYEHLAQNPIATLCSLSDLLNKPDFEPRLEAKFRLAFNLANTVFDMHARGIAHGNLLDANVSFCNANGADQSIGTGEVDVRRPLISGFDIFPEASAEATTPARSLFRHPLDPKTVAQASLGTDVDAKTYDLYSLAMLLLSIGLWTSLENLVSSPTANCVSESVLEQLGIRCGSLYMKAVQACWNAVEAELSNGKEAQQVGSDVQAKTSRYLEACCILDSVGGLDDRLSEDLGHARAPAQQPSLRSLKSEPVSVASSSAYTYPSEEQAPQPLQPRRAPPPPIEHQASDVESMMYARPKTADTTHTRTTVEKPQRSRLFPHIPLPAEAVEQWNKVVMPQINQALRSFYRKHPESVEISLESIGHTAKDTRPTVLVICTSVAKVKSILQRKLGDLFNGSSGFALKVCRGQVLRSRKRPGQKTSSSLAEEARQSESVANNGAFQERPKNGASIGAWIGDRHLPPVSFGGLITIDDRTYGMTVHHMLDDPDQDEVEPPSATYVPSPVVMRSGAGGGHLPDLRAWYANQYADEHVASDNDDSSVEDYAAEFSDSESESGFSESAITSEYGSDDGHGNDEYTEDGDIPGIEPGCGMGYIVSQPALDDVDDSFYAGLDTQNEEHLDSFSLGEVYASSGIRRRQDQDGLVHEIDWALFEFKDDRRPDENSIPRIGGLVTASVNLPSQHVQPRNIIAASDLPGKQVQCMARTSGLQTGQILPTLTSVKIYGRTSPSHTYQVSGARLPPPSSHLTAPSTTALSTRREPRCLPLGIPGDSGAWVVEREQGQVCGHVLAWSERKRVAYICPMSVLLADIAETLEASEVRLPGGEVVVDLRHNTGISVGKAIPGEELEPRVEELRLEDEGYEDEDGDTEEEGEMPVWQYTEPHPLVVHKKIAPEVPPSRRSLVGRDVNVSTRKPVPQASKISVG